MVLEQAQIAATQKMEKDVAASHVIRGVWAITWVALQAKRTQSELCQKLIKLNKAGAPENVVKWPPML